MDLEEFVGTDFSYLRFFIPSNHQPEAPTASQYDPYAEFYPSGIDPVSHSPLTLFDAAAHQSEGGKSLGFSLIPGFVPEIPSMNSDAELYGETKPKLTPGPRSERDRPSGSSFDADLYGSPPHNLSPPRGSDRSNSSQDDNRRGRQLIRKFDTLTLLYAIPEVCLHSTIFV